MKQFFSVSHNDFPTFTQNNFANVNEMHTVAAVITVDSSQLNLTSLDMLEPHFSVELVRLRSRTNHSQAPSSSVCPIWKNRIAQVERKASGNQHLPGGAASVSDL